MLELLMTLDIEDLGGLSEAAFSRLSGDQVYHFVSKKVGCGQPDGPPKKRCLRFR